MKIIKSKGKTVKKSISFFNVSYVTFTYTLEKMLIQEFIFINGKVGTQNLSFA